MPQSQCQRGDMRHTGDGRRLSCRLPSELKHKAGPFRSIHSAAPCLDGPCCLIARLARYIKQPILFIGDLILYVTLLNFGFVLGLFFLPLQFIQEVKWSEDKLLYKASLE